MKSSAFGKINKAAIISTIALLMFIGLCIFVVHIIEDDTRPPVLPTESTANTLTITSNGCCFWVEDVAVSLLDENGQKTELATHEYVYMYDIFKHKIPAYSDTHLSLFIEFKSFYGDEAVFSMSVMDYVDINDLRQTGVLIYFQEKDDMYLNIIAGGNHKSFKMGDQDSRWILMDKPNIVYKTV